MVISLDEIVVFEISKSDYIVHSMSFEEASQDTKDLPICGLSLIADHKNQYYR